MNVSGLFCMADKVEVPAYDRMVSLSMNSTFALDTPGSLVPITDTSSIGAARVCAERIARPIDIIIDR